MSETQILHTRHTGVVIKLSTLFINALYKTKERQKKKRKRDETARAICMLFLQAEGGVCTVYVPSRQMLSHDCSLVRGLLGNSFRLAKETIADTSL